MGKYKNAWKTYSGTDGVNYYRDSDGNMYRGNLEKDGVAYETRESQRNREYREREKQKEQQRRAENEAAYNAKVAQSAAAAGAIGIGVEIGSLFGALLGIVGAVLLAVAFLAIMMITLAISMVLGAIAEIIAIISAIISVISMIIWLISIVLTAWSSLIGFIINNYAAVSSEMDIKMAIASLAIVAVYFIYCILVISIKKSKRSVRFLITCTVVIALVNSISQYMLNSFSGEIVFVLVVAGIWLAITPTLILCFVEHLATKKLRGDKRWFITRISEWVGKYFIWHHTGLIVFGTIIIALGIISLFSERFEDYSNLFEGFTRLRSVSVTTFALGGLNIIMGIIVRFKKVQQQKLNTTKRKDNYYETNSIDHYCSSADDDNALGLR